MAVLQRVRRLKIEQKHACILSMLNPGKGPTKLPSSHYQLISQDPARTWESNVVLKARSQEAPHHESPTHLLGPHLFELWWMPAQPSKKVRCPELLWCPRSSFHESSNSGNWRTKILFSDPTTRRSKAMAWCDFQILRAANQNFRIALADTLGGAGALGVHGDQCTLIPRPWRIPS